MDRNNKSKENSILDLQQKFNSLKEQYDTALSELQKAETKLVQAAESQNRFKMFFEQLPVGAAQIETSTGKFIRINQRYSDLVGYSIEEMISIDFMQITVPEDIEQDLSNMNRLIAGEINEFTMEKRYISKSGKVVWVQLTVSPLWKKGETPDYHIAVVKDISERKQAEKAVIESQRLNAIGEMAASIAHDFNNSLQAIMGNIELLKLNAKPSKIIHEFVNNTSSIISDVASRIKSLQRFGDKKRENEDYAFIALNTIIDDSVIQLKPLWKNKLEKEGITVNIKTDFGDIPEIYGNSGELKTVFHNIIKNSIEAMPSGGEVNIITAKRRKKVFVTISDTGIGMNEETKLKIFQPFYTTKGFEVGRGLGMSGVYSIVKEHDGDIAVVESDLNKGTTIEISFPLIESKKTTKEKITKESTPQNFKELNVLWVEDEKIIQVHSRVIVESLGHICDVAENGECALEYLNNKKYDIVITDIGMPKMNGWELANAVRNKFGEQVKVAVVSGWNVDEKEKKKHNVDYSLDKPFNTSKLKKIFADVQSQL